MTESRGNLSTADMVSAGEEREHTQTEQMPRERTDSADMAPPARTEMPPQARTDGAPTNVGGTESRSTPLLPSDATSDLRSRWDSVQTGFVDEPRRAVEQADSLVAEVMKRLAETFANERSGLEQQWDRGDEVSTEDLRIAMQRYRSFFDRLLSF
jgi:hypothetical protein